MMKFKNVQANNALQVEIDGGIEYGWTNQLLRYETDKALNNGVEVLDVYLNTPGGNVYEATEIVNQFKRFKKVRIICGALVASAGTYIMSHFNVQSYANSQFMIHKPSSAPKGNEDQIKADLKALENLTSNYRTTYATRFSKTEDEIEQMWKTDYWMTAQEAKELGLVNEIIEGESNLDESVIAMMTASGCPVIPKFKKENQKNDKMDRVKLIASLGLNETATDEQINTKIESLKTDALKNNDDAKQKAEDLVKKAQTDKRITGDSVAAYMALAMANYDQTKIALESLPKISAGSIFVEKGNGVDNIDRTAWSLQDYLDKDPKALEALSESDPEKVKALNAKYAG